MGLDPNDTSRIDGYMHNYMTDLIEDMETSLSEYGKSKGYNISFSDYKKIASVGLEENIRDYMKILDNLIDETEQAELDLINEAILNEVRGKPGAKGKMCIN